MAAASGCILSRGLHPCNPDLQDTESVGDFLSEENKLDLPVIVDPKNETVEVELGKWVLSYMDETLFRIH